MGKREPVHTAAARLRAGIHQIVTAVARLRKIDNSPSGQLRIGCDDRVERRIESLDAERPFGQVAWLKARAAP
jgi:hypothetical protein